MNLFTVEDHTTPIYVRDASLWASALVSSLTAISPWNSIGDNTKAGVLVSPIHVLFASHFTPSVGATIRFVGVDGTVVDRTLSAVSPIGADINGSQTDITVGVLDSDVTAGIAFMKVFPADVSLKLPSFSNDNTLQAASTNQNAQLSIRDIYQWKSFLGFNVPNETVYNAFYLPFVGGDSGSPVFVIFENELVLLCVDSTQGSGSGASMAYNINAINAAMTTLGGGYQLTQVDLSAYPDL